VRRCPSKFKSSRWLTQELLQRSKRLKHARRIHSPRVAMPTTIWVVATGASNCRPAKVRPILCTEEVEMVDRWPPQPFADCNEG